MLNFVTYHALVSRHDGSSHMLGQLRGVIGSSLLRALGRDVLKTSGGQNVTYLVRFAVHSGGLSSPGKPSERNSASHLLCESIANITDNHRQNGN